ncbi:CheR family methyltransferase [Geoanaerobacter pelophilus]|uniref:CheR family methyltransferase n=1 Tax=Geoanaerobacter pelophilus TaxID=60036 RepID=UPI000A26C30C|nr:CheR family methyltransferase [Geoanaerobacter pelophilus]
MDRRLSGGGFASLPDAFHYELTGDDFARVRGLIYRMAGISLAPGKFDMVYSRLARRLRVRGLDSFAQYLRLVEMGDEEESEAFINALTTNMTSFFREPHHFRMLAERLQKRRGRPVSIWSCASSSGEEPYSIAMTALETLDDPSGLEILATDIDTAVLSKARQGVYPMDQLAKVPLHLRKRFFLRGEGKNDGFARVKDELRQAVFFKRLNLLDDKWPVYGKFDFVFCRNVMIYFDRETQHAILNKIARVLNPDGLLFVGHSESFHHTQELFRLCGTTAYALRG